MELLQEMEREAQAVCRKIAQDADAEAAKALADADARAAELARMAREATERRLREKETMLVAAAQIENHRALVMAKQELVDEALRDAWRRVEALPKSKEYPALFLRLAQEALEGVSGAVVVHVARGDARVAKECLAAIKASVSKVLEDGEFAGGLEVETEDGKVRVSNTLESRFARARSSAVLRAGETLFD